MKPSFRRRRILIIGFAALFFIPLLVLWKLSSDLIAPPRRAVQTYHQEILSHPAAHGLKIRLESALDQRVPLIIAEPTSTPSPKGQILRQQIAELGHPLPRLGSIHANLVLLHGRKGRKEDLLPIAERYTALGFRCLIPDLPAHGDSPLPHSQYGSGTFERDLPARLLAELATRHHFDPAPAYLWGLSMGGSFAIHAASQPASPFEKIIVLSSFDQLDGVLTDNAARYLGPFLARHFIAALRQICRARSDFDPAEVRPADRADRLTQPTLVLHGTADQFVATSRGEALHRALASPQKRFLPITDATHDNPLTTPQAVHAAIMEFLLSSTQSKNSHRNSPAHAPSSL